MKIIGHRGAKGLAPENTLAAIKLALKHNVDEVEIDVRVTKDGVPVVIHNPTIKRYAGKRVAIAKHTYDDLKAAMPDLPKLEEAIMLVKRRVPMMIDTKPGVDTAAIIKLLHVFLKNGWKPKDFTVASRSPKILNAYYTNLPAVDRIVLERVTTKRGLKRAEKYKARAIGLHSHLVKPAFIKKALGSGVYIRAYPINSPSQAEQWRRHGLHGVITDFPDRFADSKD